MFAGPCRDGVTRCFGFVGFKTAEQAQVALKYFDRSFMGASRLAISMAESLKDASKSDAKGKASQCMREPEQAHNAHAQPDAHAEHGSTSEPPQPGRKRRQRSKPLVRSPKPERHQARQINFRHWLAHSRAE